MSEISLWAHLKHRESEPHHKRQLEQMKEPLQLKQRKRSSRAKVQPKSKDKSETLIFTPDLLPDFQIKEEPLDEDVKIEV